MDIYAGFSKDAIHWEINHEPITFAGEDQEILQRQYRYDPRVCFIEDRYYITWCNGYHGPTIGVAYTFDFQTFVQLENAFLPYNRNGVLFPRKINGKYAMLFPSKRYQDIHRLAIFFYRQSPDLEYWGHHRFVMGTFGGDASAWQATKIGPGPVPIETDRGMAVNLSRRITHLQWFRIPYGLRTAHDLEQPWKVLSPQQVLHLRTISGL